MDKQLFSFYRTNTIYLFVVAALLIAVSILATVLVLVPAHTLFQQAPAILTIVLWIALVLGIIVGEGKQAVVFTMVVSLLGFISSFTLATTLFIDGHVDSLTTFLFWVSQILVSVFILSSYFSIQAYIESNKKKVRAVRAPRAPRAPRTPRAKAPRKQNP